MTDDTKSEQAEPAEQNSQLGDEEIEGASGGRSTTESTVLTEGSRPSDAAGTKTADLIIVSNDPNS